MNTNMQKVVRHILYLNGMAHFFDDDEDFHLRLVNPPYLPLVIERHGDEVSITHYVEHNGDQLRDPEMVFSLAGVNEMPRTKSMSRVLSFCVCAGAMEKVRTTWSPCGPATR